MGRRKLSIDPTTTAPQNNMKKPHSISPVKNRYRDAGTQINAVPTKGIREANAIIAPQNKPGKPANHRPKPPTTPWVAAVSSDPSSADLLTSTTSLNNTSSWLRDR